MYLYIYIFKYACEEYACEIALSSRHFHLAEYTNFYTRLSLSLDYVQL